MSSNSSPDKADRGRLPFEPAKSRSKPPKKPASAVPSDRASASGQSTTPKSSESKSFAAESSSGNEAIAIPDVVSRRMVKRMALLCGIPSVFGMSTFFVSYYLLTNDIVELPNYAVLLTSLGFFGLGVLGLSYGVLSASWDEEEPGSWLGFSEFKTNFGRMREAWKNSKKS